MCSFVPSLLKDEVSTFSKLPWFGCSFISIASEMRAECFLDGLHLRDEQEHRVYCHRRSIQPVTTGASAIANSLVTIPLGLSLTPEWLQTYNPVIKNSKPAATQMKDPKLFQNKIISMFDGYFISMKTVLFSQDWMKSGFLARWKRGMERKERN